MPENLGMSGRATLWTYGLLSLTPKFLSPLSSRRMNTPTWSMPTRAEEERGREWSERRISIAFEHGIVSNICYLSKTAIFHELIGQQQDI